MANNFRGYFFAAHCRHSDTKTHRCRAPQYLLHSLSNVAKVLSLTEWFLRKREWTWWAVWLCSWSRRKERHWEWILCGSQVRQRRVKISQTCRAGQWQDRSGMCCLVQCRARCTQTQRQRTRYSCWSRAFSKSKHCNSSITTYKSPQRSLTTDDYNHHPPTSFCHQLKLYNYIAELYTLARWNIFLRKGKSYRFINNRAPIFLRQILPNSATQFVKFRWRYYPQIPYTPRPVGIVVLTDNTWK